MLSLLTNPSATSALQALAATQRALSTVQTQISTGLRVASSEDDGAYWSIAASMTSRVGELKAVNSGLDVTSAIISTTTAALTSILGMVQKMSALTATAQTSGVDVSTIQTEIAQLQKGIIGAANSATFNGVNWLVTRVVGTEAATDVRYDDTTRSTANEIAGNQIDGTDHDQATYTVSDVVSKTLGSTSSSSTSISNSVLFTDTSVTTTPPSNTVTATNQTTATTSSGDPTGYQIGIIPLTVTSDGAILTGSEDFHMTELFQSFFGSYSGTLQENYTDQSISEPLPADEQPPAFSYAASTTDILDAPILLASGPTNILNMVLTNSADAAAAAPAISDALSGITRAMAFLGGLQNTVTESNQANTNLIGALTTGIGSLVDADMNEASTRLTALQTQEQLGIQSLSVANDDSQIILKLFQ